MKVNNREYGFSIQPHFGKVLAEIYRIEKPIGKFAEPLHIHLVSKNFGKWYRDTKTEDYKQARLWVDDTLLKIFTANKEQ